MKFKDLFLLPNLITLSRLIVVILLFTSFNPSDFNYISLIVIIALIGLSDSLDGIVARRYNLVSKLGIILDPFTDRVVFLLLLLWINNLIPNYFLYGVIIREVLILIGSIYVLITEKTVKVSNKGKASTVFVGFLEGYAPDIFGENGSFGQIPTLVDLLNKVYLYISLQIILYGKYTFLVLGTAFLILLINKYVDWSIEKSYLSESAMEADSDK